MGGIIHRVEQGKVLTPYKLMFVLTSLDIGGAERQLVLLLKHLPRALFKPVLVCLKEPGPLSAKVKEMGIPIYSRFLANKYDIRVLPRLVALMKRELPHIVWTRSIGDKMFWGRLAAKMSGVPLIISSIHYMESLETKKKIIGFFNKILTPITDLFIAVSYNQKEYLTKVEKLPSHKIEVIYNGIDLQEFKPNRSPGQVKKEINIPLNSTVIGQVGRLRPEKGHRVFLHAAKKVCENKKNVIFILIGDGPERDSLMKLSSELGLNNKVLFLGSRTDVPDLVNAMDICTLSSYMETFPNALLEYMSLKKPVVAPKVGGIPEIITDGREGFLFKVGDPTDMASKLLALISDKEKRLRMGEAGFFKVSSTFSIKTSVDKIIKTLDLLLQRKAVK